jgi:DNA-directed RNA polymerase subunit alpha
MHQIQIEIGTPKIKVNHEEGGTTTFSITPLPPGYGTTLGNTFRRVLLSSLPGVTATGIKIKGITHEYTSVPGVQDSVLDICLNIKNIKFKKDNSEVSILKLKAEKEGVVTAGDIECPSDVEIINKDAYITTITKKGGKMDMQIIVEKGVGYLPANNLENEDAELIKLDAFFSPVKNVNYKVESTRVKDMTNLDQLSLEVTTDGSITAEEAIKFASNVITSYFTLFNQENQIVEPDFISDLESISEREKEISESKPKQESYTPIEILGLSPRTLNALINAEIGSIEQLVKCSEAKLSNFRGFGKKALTEVSEALATRDLALADD